MAYNATDTHTVEDFLTVASFSTFFSTTLKQHPHFFPACTQAFPEDYLQVLEQACDEVDSLELLLPAMRLAHHLNWCRLIWHQVLNKSSLTTIMQETSQFADACLCYTLRRLKAWQGCHDEFRILALGKLGGKELNFSSDIDIIFVHANTMAPQTAITLARQLTQCLHTVTDEGFVFRVDTRLRPHGRVGPLAISAHGLCEYLQAHGRDWERYAYVKARIIGKPSALSRAIMNDIRAFVYRRYIDFSVIDALRQMKRLIHQEVLQADCLDDIKRGDGGIRQIEFIHSAFQIVRGGKLTALHSTSTRQALQVLLQQHLLKRQMVNDLLNIYDWLRALENLLQMQANLQTHQLPKDPDLLTQMAVIMGLETSNQLQSALAQRRNRVSQYFNTYFETPKFLATAPDICEQDLGLMWANQLDKPSAIAVTKTLRFTDAENFLRLLANFRQSRQVQQLSQTARRRLDAVMPYCLMEIGQVGGGLADLTFSRWITFLEAIIRRSTYLCLLLENPAVITHCVKLFSQSPKLAEMLAVKPFLLEALLEPTPEKMTKPTSSCQESFLDSLCRYKMMQILRVANAELSHQQTACQASLQLSEMATDIIQAVFSQVIEEFSQKYQISHLQDKMAVIAYGRLASQEMHYESDLDLVFLHDLPDAVYNVAVRIAQRMIHLLCTHTASGELYQVDTRLRPTGASGPLVIDANTYIEYQKNRAWTWEHQALVRAKLLIGTSQWRTWFDAGRESVLIRQRSAQQLVKDFQTMREKCHAHHDTNSLKHRLGGMMDIEFLAQYYVLAYAYRYPALLALQTTPNLLMKAGECGCISLETAKELATTYEAYQQAQHSILLTGHCEAPHHQAVVQIWQDTFPVV